MEGIGLKGIWKKEYEKRYMKKRYRKYRGKMRGNVRDRPRVEKKKCEKHNLWEIERESAES